MTRGIYKRTKKNLLNISKAQKARFKKNNVWNKGKKGCYTLSDETKQKISKSAKKSGVGKWMSGKKLSYVTKKKMSISRKNITNGFKKGCISTRKGIKLSEELKEKMSISAIGKHSKEKNPNWKGGITSENELIRKSKKYSLWREEVFKFNNFTCQKYGISGCELNAHHINNFAKFPELRTSSKNGITLSKKAHREFHKKYGIKNNTKQQLLEFLNN